MPKLLLGRWLQPDLEDPVVPRNVRRPRLLVRPTTDVDPGSEPDANNNSIDDETRRDTEHHRVICNCNCNALRL